MDCMHYVVNWSIQITIGFKVIEWNSYHMNFLNFEKTILFWNLKRQILIAGPSAKRRRVAVFTSGNMAKSLRELDVI